MANRKLGEQNQNYQDLASEYNFNYKIKKGTKITVLISRQVVDLRSVLSLFIEIGWLNFPLNRGEESRVSFALRDKIGPGLLLSSFSFNFFSI